MEENIIGLATHTGEALRRWRRGMAACVGVALLDEPRPDEQTDPHG